MILGVDLEKDEALLHAAYNDAAGVTARFNLNLLVRMNRELGANFDVSAFAHCAIYNREQHRIEMHLVSRKAQKVRLCGRTIAFAAGESIHTENSYKYSIPRLARARRRSRLAAARNPGPTRMTCSRSTRSARTSEITQAFACRRSRSPPRAPTTSRIAVVAADRSSGDSRCPNGASTSSAPMPTRCDSCSRPWIVRLNRIVADQEQQRPADQAEHHLAVGMAVRMRKHELVADRNHDDARDDRHVQIGVGQPRDPAGILRLRDAVRAGLRALVEVDPPHRQTAGEGDKKGADRIGCPGELCECRAGDQDRLAERDDDEQCATLRHMAAFDGPILARRAAEARRPEAGGRRHIFDRTAPVPTAAGGYGHGRNHRQSRGCRSLRARWKCERNFASAPAAYPERNST